MVFWIFDFLNIPLPLLCWQKISCKLVFRFRPLNVPAMSFGYKLCKVFPPRGNLFSLHQQRGWMESINREEASKRKPFIMVHIALMLTKRNQMFCFCFKSLLWNDLQPIDWSNIKHRDNHDPNLLQQSLRKLRQCSRPVIFPDNQLSRVSRSFVSALIAHCTNTNRIKIYSRFVQTRAYPKMID